MFRSRVLWKLYGSYALLIVIAVAGIGLLLFSRLRADALSDIDDNLRSEAALLVELARPALEAAAPGSSADGPTQALQNRVARAGRQLGTRLTVIAVDGRVLADSARDPQKMDDHSQRPEVRGARETGEGTASRRSDTLGAQLRYLALAVEDDRSTLVGYARVSRSLESIRRELGALAWRILLGGLLAVPVALALALFLARRITYPLDAMTEAAEALAAGNVETRIDVPVGRDELGALARAFNSMSRRLRSQMETITLDSGQLRAILASMGEGVVAVDAEERVVHMNAAAGRILDVDPGDAVGKPLWELTRVRGISEALEEAFRSPADDEGPSQERVLTIPGRSDRTLELRVSPLRNGRPASPGARGGRAGDSHGAVLVLEDVTELRRLETIRSDFVGNVSHELKTPVTAIRGLTETLLDDPEMPPETRDRFLGKIQGQALRLSSLVSDLLSLSRLESQGQGSGEDGDDIEAEPLPLRSALEASVRAFQPASDAKNIQVEVDLPEEPLHVHADLLALQEAVGNLLDNAIKYSPAGSSVEVRLRRLQDEALIEVQDHGPGIEPRHQDRIFERFYRVDKARSRELGGTGLGLAIVKHTVLSLGGRISFLSQPGAGSTFRITLPLAS